jgi:carbon monoxide dehydrogenase subunit G
MKLAGERFIPAAQEQVWSALNDPQVLQACIPGCESVEPIEGGGYTVLMVAKVGPVSAKFKGRILLSDLNPPTAYTLSFDGQGGMAGFGKGTARVRLNHAENQDSPGTVLDFEAEAQVGGKLAQIGSRLIDSTAAKMTEEFFARFVLQFQEPVLDQTAPVPSDGGTSSLWTKIKRW